MGAFNAMTPAESIAAAVLESHSAAYWALEPTQHVARAKVIASAAKAIQPALDAMMAEHDKAHGRELECPWCKERDFDEVGLKIHISAGQCEAYNALSIELPRTKAAATANP